MNRSPPSTSPGAGQISRREMIKGAAAFLGGAVVAAAAPAEKLRPPLQAGEATSVAATTAGRVRGYVDQGIHTFKGVPYGGPTGGAIRFGPAARPEEWSGIRDTRAYGPSCPQAPVYRYLSDDETAFLLEPHYDPPSEDCLRLNVWTPDLGASGSRPVLVWIHGGGCTAWSGQFLSCFHGRNLAESGDAVVVAVTHRLGPLGFLNLAELGGEKYAHSGNVGLLDLVLALEWVRDNIAAFGGDPRSVTLFGQSGGGAKIAALMGMPSAQGLFHKAMVLGTTGGTKTAANATKLAAAVLAELGLEPAAVGALQDVPVDRLLAAGDQALRQLVPGGATPGGFYPVEAAFGWGPVVGGADLPRAPFETDGPACSAAVPLVIGTVLNECMPDFFRPELEAMTDEQLGVRLAPACGERTAEFITAYRRSFPGAKPVELLAIMYSTYVRRTAVAWAEHKAAQRAAPVYTYWFQWHTPVLDGRPRSFHLLDLPFLFANTDRCAAMTGGSTEARALAARMSGALVNFARTGRPGGAGLPEWPAFTVPRRPVMVFDAACAVRDDPDAELRRVFGEVIGRQPGLAT